MTSTMSQAGSLRAHGVGSRSGPDRDASDSGITEAGHDSRVIRVSDSDGVTSPSHGQLATARSSDDPSRCDSRHISKLGTTYDGNHR